MTNVDSPNAVMSVTMRKELSDAIRAYCSERQIPLTVWARQALQRELKRCMALEATEATTLD